MNQPNNQQNSSSLFLPQGYNADGRIITRRNFLRLAGAAAVTLPFLKPQEARAAIDTSSFIRGTLFANISDYNRNGIRHTGVRAYIGNHRTPDHWPIRPWGGPVCLTIYPTPNNFYHGDNYGNNPNNNFYQNISKLFSNAQPGDMISCWQEPEGINWKHKSHIGGIDGQFMRDILGYMMGVKNATGNRVLVGAISGGSKSWAESAKYFIRGLDFYNLDIYRKDYRDEDHVVGRLAYWQGNVYGKNGTDGYGYNESTKQNNATVGVTECNAHATGQRPCFFYRVAKWVAQQKNQKWRCFHTFWTQYYDPTNKSGPWLDPGKHPEAYPTIFELTNIGHADFSAEPTYPDYPEPSGCG